MQFELHKKQISKKQKKNNNKFDIFWDSTT